MLKLKLILLLLQILSSRKGPLSIVDAILLLFITLPKVNDLANNKKIPHIGRTQPIDELSKDVFVGNSLSTFLTLRDKLQKDAVHKLPTANYYGVSD